MSYLRRVVRKLIPRRADTSAVGTTVVLAGVVGVTVGLLVLATDGLIDLLRGDVFGRLAEAASGLPSPWGFFMARLVPGISLTAMLVLVAGMLRRWAPEARGPGVGEVMNCVSREGGYIRSRVIFLKPLATALCIGAGAPLGLEGPVVQMGGALGSLAGRRFQLGIANIRILVAAGAAAGMAVKYGAPIGGAVLSAELILGSTGPAALLPLIVASFLGVLTRHAVMGNVAEFVVAEPPAFAATDYALFAVLGIAAGVASVYFIRMIVATDDLANALFARWWTKALACGLGVGLICALQPKLLGTGQQVVQRLMERPDYSICLLLVFILLKPLLCSATLAGGASGGVFAPSLLTGAALGGLFARLAGGALGLELAPSAYVMVGMAAVMGAVMRAPLQAILITFELTNNYAMIPPLMITCVIGLKVSEMFEPESAFTWQLARAGRKLRRGMDFSLLERLTVEDVMDGEFVALPQDALITEVADLVRASENRTFPVVGADGHLSGLVMLARLVAAGSEAAQTRKVPAVRDLLEPKIVYLEPEHALEEAWEMMGNYDYDCLPVCRPGSHGLELVGICEKEAIQELHDRLTFVTLSEELGS